jgi:hypothetical protein
VGLELRFTHNETRQCLFTTQFPNHFCMLFLPFPMPGIPIPLYFLNGLSLRTTVTLTLFPSSAKRQVVARAHAQPSPDLQRNPSLARHLHQSLHGRFPLPYFATILARLQIHPCRRADIPRRRRSDFRFSSFDFRCATVWAWRLPASFFLPSTAERSPPAAHRRSIAPDVRHNVR